MVARDNRVDVNNEVLSNMKVIKLQAWEHSFKERIERLRRIELKDLRNYILASCVVMMMWTTVPLCVALCVDNFLRPCSDAVDLVFGSNEE